MKKVNNKKRKWHIKPRIFIMLLILLVAIFSSVFVAFNLFINNYIDGSVKTQLLTLTASFSMHDEEAKKKEQQELPDMSKQTKNKTWTHADVFVISGDYNVVKYDESIDKNEPLQIAEFIKNKSTPLDSIDRMYVETDEENYYISLVRNEKEDESYYIFFVNVTSMENLVDTINITLGIILAIALAISFFIANIIATSITNPVKKLSGFATKIGQGDFSTNEFSFVDEEFNNLANEMNLSAEKLGNYDAEQRAFFQNVSHELRTPLMSIKCHAEGMEHNLLDKDDSSRIIISETDRLSEMVDDLLYISRMEAVQTPEMQENDLRETLSFCIERLKPVAEQDGKRLIFDFDSIPVLFKYNEKHMTRACTNLISNALRYAKSTITVTCKGEAETIVISVTDDGDGISASDLPHIFERFYKGRDGKYGIGLSIVKLVVELHGGEVSACSDELTVFKMIFPV